MVSRDDLAQADMLNQRATDLQRALAIVSDPTAVIDAFTVKARPQAAAQDETGPPLSEPEPKFANVSADGITTPPQMMTAIREQLQARYDAIVQQLSSMGIT